MTDIDYLFKYFENLEKTQGRVMAVNLRFAAGSGVLLITKEEWAAQPDDAARKKLIRIRRENLYQRISRRDT